MDKKRKSLLFISGGILVLLIIVFIVRFLVNSPINREIPEISDTSLLSIPVKEQISDAVKKARRNPSAANLGMLGMIYHSSANYTEAAQSYELAIKRDEKEWIWNYYNGYLNIEMGESTAAIENFNIVLQKNSDINLAWYYLGEEYKNLRNVDLAKEAFEKITTKAANNAIPNATTRKDHFPLSTYANFELSRLYFDSGKTDLAETKLNELIQSNSLFGPSYKLLGNIYNLKGDTTLGKKFTIRSNDLINYSPPVDPLIDKLVLLSRSELYLLKKIDEAERSFHSDWALRLVNQGLQYMPDNGYLITKAINIYLWKNLNDEAIALTDKHMKLFWDNYIEIKNTGMIFFKKGIYPQAAKYWTRALELKPDEVLIQEYLAKSLWFTGDKQKSFEILNVIIEKNQGNVDVLADVIDLLVQFGSNEKANDLLAKLKKIDPLNPKLQRLSAEFAFVVKHIPKAIILYENSFKGDPEDVKTIRNLGEIYKYQQMWAKYISLYSKAMEYNANSPDFLARMGEVLISCPDTSLRNIEEGKEYSERAFTYYNCPPDILIAAGSHLAYAYAMLGDKQKAVTTISQTINIGRREKIAESQQAKLEGLLKAFQNLDSQ